MGEPVSGAPPCGQNSLTELAQDTLGLTPAQTSKWFVKTALLSPHSPILTFSEERTSRGLILQWTRHLHWCLVKVIQVVVSFPITDSYKHIPAHVTQASYN